MTQKTRKIKFNILDVIIILVILGVVAGILIKYDLAGKVGLGANSDTIEVTFIVENIQEASQNYIKEGKMFYHTAQDIEFAVLKEIRDIRVARHYMETDRGILQTELPGNIDITGVLTCTGKKTKDGFMVNGNTFISAGKELNLHMNNIEISVTILEVLGEAVLK